MCIKIASITLLIVIAITRPSCCPTDATSNRTLHLQPNQVTLPDGNISTLPTNTTLFCIVESSSIVELPRQVNISWELPNGTTLNSTELVGVSSSISVDNPLSYSRVEALVLNQLSYRDAGIYTCKAEYVDLDGRFNLSGTVELQLLSFLLISSNKRRIEVAENDTEVELCCEMVGYIRPDRDLRWYKDGEKVVKEDNRKRISFTRGSENAAQDGDIINTHSRMSVLRIRDPLSSDSGVYTCGLSGPYDVVSSRIRLVVGSVVATLPPLNTQQIPVSETLPPSTIIAIVVGSVVLLILVIVVILTCLLARMYKKYQQKVVTTVPNVSYGVHPSLPEIGPFEQDPADPMYESIRGVHYEIARSSSIEYYVNEGMGPNE